MNLENLTLVEGWSSEAIIEKLEEENIKFNVYYNEKFPFFGKTNICIGREWTADLNRREKVNWEKIYGLFGMPDYFRNESYYYYARYRMEEGFDISKLDGKITFRNGLLVKSTQINF